MSNRPIGISKLTKDLLANEEMAASAAVTLGTLAVLQLREFGQVGFYINPAGIVEVAPLPELALDSLSLEDAMRALMGRGYTDEQVLQYVRERRARLSNVLRSPVELPTLEEKEIEDQEDANASVG